MMLELRDVSYTYTSYRVFARHTRHILRDISLKLDFNDTLAIMGRSGCGKSTLAKIACGLLTPNVRKDSTQVLFCSKPLLLRSLAQRRAFYAQVQILFQDCIGSLNPTLSCVENCLEPLMYLKGIHKEQGIEQLRVLAKDLGLSDDILFRQVGGISGGEAQRICLLRALSIEPKLLILDESTSGLDYELAMMIIAYLKQWRLATGASILLITHDDEVAYRLCDRVRIINSQGMLEP
ncbi:ABC transporter ATP-binding protein [Helicobacter marmotae]|nr:ATP-binding cassette domain-containing protein [Helicobacter marmotae]